MAKRFTSTELWNEDWFCVMPLDYKLFWYYMLSKCDHAGIYKVNVKIFNHINRAEINSNTAIDFFNEGKQRIRILNEQNWFIEDFFYYQYGSSFNIKNRVHESIYKVYKKYNIDVYSIRGLNEVNIDLIEGVKDKELLYNNKINKESEILNSNGTWEDEKKYFLADEQYQMGICTTYKLKKEQVDLYLKDFLNMLELNQDYKSCKELRRHFTNWVKKKEESKLPKQYNQADHTKYKINLK